jgi:hypothetical protein
MSPRKVAETLPMRMGAQAGAPTSIRAPALGLKALVEAPRWNSPYLKKAKNLLDPRGRPYHTKPSAPKERICSSCCPIAPTVREFFMSKRYHGLATLQTTAHPNISFQPYCGPAHMADR